MKPECKRWKNLALERFANMETLKKKLEEKHNDEVVCYKSETSHWLSELTSTKNELSDMKIQLSDQRASTIQQMSEKNHIIENLQLSNIYLQVSKICINTLFVIIPNPGLNFIATVVKCISDDIRRRVWN